MDMIVRFFSFMVILANPTEPGDLEDSATDATSSSDVDTDSGDSSPTVKPQQKVKIEKNIGRHEHEQYAVPEPRQCDGYEMPVSVKPRVPQRAHVPDPNSHLRTYLTDQSVFSVDGYASSVRPPISHFPNSHSQSSNYISLPIDPNTLSSKNVSTDAFACLPPYSRRERTSKSKNVDEEKKTKGVRTPIKELSSSLEETALPRKENLVQKNDDIEDFIREFIKNTSTTSNVKHIKFFDAAVVYDKTDFEAVQQFIFEVKTIVKVRLQEDVRIELFDSLEFAQSKVMVVEDVVERCSIVFVYLTEHCNEDTFRLFCDEGIGLTRLGISGSHKLWDHERQWVLKPVHTQPTHTRRYKTPVGLVSLQGVDWYDKDSLHTKERLVALLEHAVRQRKRKEGETNVKLDSNRHKEDTGGFKNAKPSREKVVKVIEKRNMQIGKQSLSEDALSLPSQENHTLNPIRGGQEPINRFVNGNGPVASYTMSSPVQHPNVPQPPPYTSLPQQQYQAAYIDQYGQHASFNQNVPSQGNGPIQYSAYSSQQQYPGYSIPNQNVPSQGNVPIQYSAYTSQQQYPGYSIPNQNPLQPHIPGYNRMQQYTHSQPSLQNLQNDQHYQMQGHMAQYPPHPSNPIQQIPTGQNVIIQSAGLCPPEHIQHVSRAPGVTPPSMQYQYVQNSSHYEPSQLSRRQPSPRPEQQSGMSEPGNYMRDNLNDAPPHSNLSVVSRVTGKLITNPNLSTDDIEVDDPSGRDDSFYMPHTPKKHQRAPVSGHSNAHQLLSGRPMSSGRTDSSSSDDSDFDLPMPKGKLKSSKGKRLNIYGCKNIQLGSGNQVVENKSTKRRKRSTRKHSSAADSKQLDEPSMNNLKLSINQETDMSIARCERSSVSSRTTMAEDGLDISSSTDGRTGILPSSSSTDDVTTQHADYIGEITSDIYKRRAQKRYQSSGNTTGTMAGRLEINCFDKPELQNGVTKEWEGLEYNVLDGECSNIENVLDSERYEEGDIDEEVIPDMNRHLGDSKATSGKQEEEVKAYNKEACFAFSYFKEKQQKLLMNPLQSIRNSLWFDNYSDDLD